MKNQKNILVVDDQPINRNLLEIYIKNINDKYNILTAENGKEAVEIAKTNDLDLIFMDIQMPIMTGIEACKIIKKTKPELPIIVVSAYLGLGFIKTDLSCFDLKLSKPINLDKIAEIFSFYFD